MWCLRLNRTVLPILAIGVFSLCVLDVRASVVSDTTICGTPEPTSTIAANDNFRYLSHVEIPVVFHVIYKTDGTGNHTVATLNEQIDTLNVAFDPADISFKIVGINRVESDQWFSMWPGYSAIGSALNADIERVLNVYIGDTDPYGGWVPGIPGPNLPAHDGAYVSYVGLPGDHEWQRAEDGRLRGRGRDLVHEAGHWLGLYHTFRWGCVDGTYPACMNNGDLVCDTPASASGCYLGEECDGSSRPWCIDSCPSQPGLDALNNYMAYSGQKCIWEFSDGQIDRMLAIGGQYRPDIGVLPIRYDDDLVVGSNESWEWFGTELEFEVNTGVVSNGLFAADSTSFTAESPGAGWDGILIAGDDGDIQFDGVIVEYADVGVEIRSDNSNYIKNTLLEDNGVGVLADYVGAGGMAPERSSFHLRESCVLNSNYSGLDPDEYGYGIWGRYTDAKIVNSTLEDNDSYGVFLENADIVVAHGMLVESNGNDIFSSDRDGMRSGVYADATLASSVGGGGFDVGPERNNIHDNGYDEISIEDTGFITLGEACSESPCPTGNTVYGTFSSSGPYLIHNLPASSIPAERVYWGTNHQSPPDPDADAFYDDGLVEYKNPLSTDEASDAGRTLGCSSETFLTGGSESARMSTQSGALTFGSTHARGRSEALEQLREQIREVRANLQRDLGADSSESLVGRLYSLQRLDRDDELEERTATMAVLSNARALLLNTQPIEGNFRATAEAALLVSMHDVLRRDQYTTAGQLIQQFSGRTQNEVTNLGLALASLAVSETSGDLEGTLSQIQDVIESYGSGREKLVNDLEATARLLQSRLDGNGRYEHGTTQFASTRTGPEMPSAFILDPAYPNPFNPETVIPFRLNHRGNVTIGVYDVLGRLIVNLVDGSLDTGRHEVTFDGANYPSGVYLIRATMQPENGDSPQSFVQRITMLK